MNGCVRGCFSRAAAPSCFTPGVTSDPLFGSAPSLVTRENQQRTVWTGALPNIHHDTYDGLQQEHASTVQQHKRNGQPTKNGHTLPLSPFLEPLPQVGPLVTIRKICIGMCAAPQATSSGLERLGGFLLRSCLRSTSFTTRRVSSTEI